jgi:hypothetical protein
MRFNAEALRRQKRTLRSHRIAVGDGGFFYFTFYAKLYCMPTPDARGDRYPLTAVFGKVEGRSSSSGTVTKE